MKKFKKVLFTVSSVSFLILSISFIIIGLVGCNKQIVDTNYNFTEAIIDDIGTVKVSKWNDYSDSDMIQIIDDKGNVYYTHSSKVILIHR